MTETKFPNNAHNTAKNLSQVAKRKTSQRIKYEADVLSIREKWGDLEQIRTQLNMSRRKVSQLLLVDPSAWTRWTQPGAQAPPHIYRALEWYLLLQAQEPVLHPKQHKREASTVRKSSPEPTEALWERGLERVSRETQRLKDELSQREQVSLMWKLLLLVNSVFMFYFILRAFLY